MTAFDGSLSELYDTPREKCELCGEYSCDCMANVHGDLCECETCSNNKREA